MSSPLDVTFVSGRVIASDWLNGVNDHVIGVESPTGSELIGFTQTGIGTVTRTVHDKFGESVSDLDFGAAVDSVTDDIPAIVSMLSSGKGIVNITDGDHKLASAWNPSAQDVTIVASPKAEFVTNAPNYSGSASLVPNIPDPIYSGYLARKNYTSAYWNTYAGNVMHHATVAETDATNMYAGGINLVSSFNFARANGAGSSVWGANIVAYSNNATGTSIGIELNCGVLVPGGTAYGLVIASAGNGGQPNNAIQIQSNHVDGQFVNGIQFGWRATEGCVTGYLINSTGQGTSPSCSGILRIANISCSASEIDIPSFVVEATQANTVNRVAIRGAATGVPPRISPLGSDANIGLQIHTKGTSIIQFMTGGTENFRVRQVAGVDSLQVGAGNGGAELSVRGTTSDADVVVTGKGASGVALRGGDAVTRVRVNTTGIGFNASTPIAKPAITGSRGANAALASLLTSLASYGLITDSTTV